MDAITQILTYIKGNPNTNPQIWEKSVEELGIEVSSQVHSTQEQGGLSPQTSHAQQPNTWK